mgnify:CR=1 FL=1
MVFVQQERAFTRKPGEERRQIAIRRAAELREEISDYQNAKASIPTGFDLEDRTARQRERLLSILGGTMDDWNDWRWQLANRISDAELLAQPQRASRHRQGWQNLSLGDLPLLRISNRSR